MKELNTQEMEQISAAGIWADLGGGIGKAIGMIVDAGTSLGGLNTDAQTPASTLGKGIGYLVELNFLQAISNIGTGIVGIVGFGIDAVGQIKNKQSA